MTPQESIARLLARQDLSEVEMGVVVESVLGGGFSAAQIGAFLVGLRMKGETIAELTGAARVLRAHALSVPGVPPHAIDTCGTGGDGSGTLNVSTAAALVVAGAGVPVAKHGNRAVSSRVGSADVLEALGVVIDLPASVLGPCLQEIGFAFLYAPRLQPALQHVAAPRRELGARTLFNLLGPLANPAGVRRQLVGVSGAQWVEPIACVLARLGCDRAWVVHGAGGVDELSLEGESVVAEVTAEGVALRRVVPEDAGLTPAPLGALGIDSVDDGAARVRAVLAGERGPRRDVVCLNAAAALVIAGAAADLRAGAEQAARTIDSGAAADVLARLVVFSTRHARAYPAEGRVG